MAKALGPWTLPSDDVPESERNTPTVEQLKDYITSATRGAQLDYIEAIARSIGHHDEGVIQSLIASRRREFHGT